MLLSILFLKTGVGEGLAPRTAQHGYKEAPKRPQVEQVNRSSPTGPSSLHSPYLLSHLTSSFTPTYKLLIILLLLIKKVPQLALFPFTKLSATFTACDKGTQCVHHLHFLAWERRNPPRSYLVLGKGMCKI